MLITDIRYIYYSGGGMDDLLFFGASGNLRNGDIYWNAMKTPIIRKA